MKCAYLYNFIGNDKRRKYENGDFIRKLGL